MLEIWVYNVVSLAKKTKKGSPKVLQLEILGAQFLNPGYNPGENAWGSHTGF